MSEVSTALGLLVFVVGIPLAFFVAWLVARLARKTGNRVTKERLFGARSVFLLAIVFGPIFVNNDLDNPIIDGETTKLATRVVMAVVVIYGSLRWLRLYRRGAS